MPDALSNVAVGGWRRHYAGRTIAVTGASGFIGSGVVSRLTTAGCRVIRITRATWEDAAAADVVFHFAAQTSVTAAAGNPPQDFEANVVPMRRLLAACAARRRRPFVVFAGTVTQSGIQSHLPVNEDVPDNPVTVYDQHKLLAENDLKAAVAAGKARGASLRLANVYGPGAHGTNEDRNVLNRMIAAAVRGETLTVYGTGDYLRDYVFVDDVVDAFLMAAACPEQVNGRHFVVGTGHGITIRAAFELVAVRVAVLTGTRVPVIALADAPLSPLERRNFTADPSGFSAATGWRPAWTLAAGIDRTVEACLCAS